ncbi:mannose-6-phosphate isomerase, class I [Corynebacterium caspium]|uniref:mannose-6-phosphate isomerase, class I n=1 Tax=Corynebacterium caspium TaxID=234828 RepID=UPI000381AC55|nr:mannose-6-phosphate isomerase, class I [Corynebacterium caspium]WKD59717.1 Mannose-6-phosphate isomerase [Corynebacterium caspium DSM 44850]
MEHLEGTIRAYPWGSRTLIPSLCGKPVPSARPEAELWFGAHPASPSTLASSGTLLDAAIAANPTALLGKRVVDDFGPNLPFLIKLLAADQPLSLQAHPSKVQAEEGYARENAAGISLNASNRNYKDPNHKPELIVALNEFHAMAGFRPLAQTLELFKALDCQPLARYLNIVDLTGADEATNLRALFTTLITIPKAIREALINDLIECAKKPLAGPEWINEVLTNVLELQERYPGDIGVLGALLLNHLTLQPGEAIYMDAGTLHAYIRGLGVEIMANSDNVLRGGLTSKFVDVGELLRVINFEPTVDPRVHPKAGHYPVPVADFKITRLTVNSTDTDSTLYSDGPAILLCTRGRIVIRSTATAAAATDTAAIYLRAGEAAWLPASEGEVLVQAVENEVDAASASGAGSNAEVFWAAV